MLTVLPHQLACALYIKIISNKFKQINDWEDGDPISIEVQRKTFLVALKLIRDSNISWKEFQIKLHATLDDDDMSTLFNEFHRLQYMDELLDAMKAFEGLLDVTHKSHVFDANEGFIMKSSILGIFLRKLIMEFKMMSFDSVNELRLSISEYLSFSSPITASQHLMVDSNMSLCTNNSDMTCMEESLIDDEKENSTIELKHLDEEGNSSREDEILSHDQVMRFIMEQVSSLENRDINALPPNRLQEKITMILHAYPDIKETYYLSFLNYIRVSESNRGTESLQLYFDHKDFIEDSSSGDISGLEKHQLKFKTFRYCALNLGIMHCCHGNYSEAIISLEECIRVAQETNDEKCLKNAMFWLSIVEEERGRNDDGYNYLYSFIGDTDKKVMDNESESTLQNIEYLGLLRFIKLKAFKGLISPSQASTLISRLGSILRVSNDAQMTRSALLDFYGFNNWAMLNCQIPLQNTKSTVSTREFSSNIIKDELLVIALCQLATLHASEKLNNETVCILSFAKSHLSLFSPFRKIIVLCELKIRFDYDIGLRNLDKAFAIGSSVCRIDPLEGKYMLALVTLLMGNISSAFKDIKRLLTLIDKSYSPFTCKPILKAKLLSLLIEIKLLSANPCDVLGLVFELIDFVKSNNMNRMLINANVCLVRIQIKLGQVGKAKSIIDKTLFKAVAFGSRYQKGLLFFLKAKSQMADFESIEEGNRNYFLSEVFSLYDKSLSFFRDSKSNARMKDVLYEQAFVCHKLQHFQERNKISTQFRLLQEQLKGVIPIMLV